MIKNKLRSIYREKRKAISLADKEKWDDLLLIQFQQFDFTNIQTILSYWPLERVNEPNTHLFSRYLQYMLPTFKLCYPVCDFSTNDMKALLVDEQTDYQLNSLGIVEPIEGEKTNATSIDLVFVPLLICDRQGNRIGFGKGYYDKFLQLCNEKVVKIGFSYFEPVDIIEDTAPFDVPLNFCITPHRIYEF